jgi:hypothetical protein
MYCLSNKQLDFEGYLSKVNVQIQGIAESKGTSKWKRTEQQKVLDDDKTEHIFKIPNTLLVEESLLFCILSPQHLSQEHHKSKMDTMKMGTTAIVGEDKVELQWANCQFKKTVKISKRNNILIMQSSSGFSKYKLFATKIDTEDSEITCFDAHIIPDNESLALVNNNDDNLSDGKEENQTRVLPAKPALQNYVVPMVQGIQHMHTNMPAGQRAITSKAQAAALSHACGDRCKTAKLV